MATVIVGCGIIGLSVAYYLSELDPELAADGNIHIIENASSPLLSASGYAGGFLARDWFSSPSASLGKWRIALEAGHAHSRQENCPLSFTRNWLTEKMVRRTGGTHRVSCTVLQQMLGGSESSERTSAGWNKAVVAQVLLLVLSVAKL